MHIQLATDGRDFIITSHLGKDIEWNISGFSQTKMVKNGRDFSDINDYLLSMPAFKQQQLFDTLLEIKEILEETFGLQELQRELTDKISNLYGVLNLAELRMYVALKAKVIYPDDLKEEYGDNDTNKDRTYLKHDYQGLVFLVIALRIMVPIWGVYLLLNIKRAGATFKEHLAVKLLAKTELLYCEEMMRLKRYVETTAISKTERDNAVVRGISAEELPNYVMANLLVRGLAIGDVNASKEGGSIISNIWGRVTHAIRELSRKNTNIKEKFQIDDYEDQDKTSKLEQYKNVQKVSIGDVEIHKYFINRHLDLALSVDPTLDVDKLNQCLKLVERMGTFVFDKHNILLVQWVLARQVPARVIRELTAHEMLGTMGVVQALLWHWGLLDLALIVTSSVDRDNLAVTTVSRKQAKKETTAILNELYPYQIDNNNKTNAKNMAHKAADDYAKSLQSYYLIASYPEGLREYYSSVEVNGLWMCPVNLLPQLTDLIAHIHSTLKTKGEK